MTRFTTKTLAAVVAAAVLGLGLAGQAQAGAKAYARNEISSFLLGGAYILLGQGTNSSSFADLASVPGVEAGVGVLDAPNSCQGPNCGATSNNNFVQYGPHLAQGDAVIDNLNIVSGPGQARNQALVNLDRTDSGSANGINSLSGPIELITGQLNFSFVADPFLEVLLHDNAGPGSSADSNINFSITLQDAGGATVFEYVPDGTATAVGGVVNLEPFSLNTGLAVLGPGPQGPNTFNPGAGAFDVDTVGLAPGLYTLNIQMAEEANAVANKVPEPATLFLLGGSIVGLGFARRRRSQLRA